MRSRLALPLLALPFLAVGLGLACRRDLPSSVTAKDEASRALATTDPTAKREVNGSGEATGNQTTKPTASASRYSPAELHKKNPMDWVGALHNAGLRVFINELKRPGATFETACVATTAWLGDTRRLAAMGISVPPSWRALIARAEADSTACGAPSRRPSRKHVEPVSWNRVLVPHTPLVSADSETAAALVDQATAAAAQATDPNQLAALLSPILDASFSLEDTSAAVVQATVAETQSSTEYWYANNYGAIQDVVEAEYNDLLNGCFSGQYEGMSYEVDGVTYTCSGGSWLASAGSVRHGAKGYLRAVSLYSTRRRVIATRGPRPARGMSYRGGPRHSASCDVGNEALFAGIVVSDAFGAALGAWRGWALGPAGIAAGAAIWGLRGSAYGSWSAAGVRAYCMLME